MTEGKKDSWFPTQCGMPDLSALHEANLLGLILNVAFCGGGPRDPTAKVLVANYVRLVDQTLWAYNSARESIQRFVSTPNNVIGPLFRAASQLETCINTLDRAIRFAQKIRRRQHAPQVGKPRVLSDPVSKRVRDLRSALEHLEGEILRHEIASGDASILVARNDEIKLGGMQITYGELAGWIRELHTLAQGLTCYSEKE